MAQHELLVAHEVLAVDGLHERTWLVWATFFKLLSIEPLFDPLHWKLALIKLSVIRGGTSRLKRVLVLGLADVGGLTLRHLVDNNLRARADMRWVL